jgi:hypothetical protein
LDSHRRAIVQPIRRGAAEFCGDLLTLCLGAVPLQADVQCHAAFPPTL